MRQTNYPLTFQECISNPSTPQTKPLQPPPKVVVTVFHPHGTVSVQIRGLEWQRVEKVGREGRRERPRAARVPGAATNPSIRRVARVNEGLMLLRVLLVLHAHETLADSETSAAAAGL